MVILIFLWHLIQKISNIITFKVLNTRETLLRNSRVEVENNELSDLEPECFQLFSNKIDSSLQPLIAAKSGLKQMLTPSSAPKNVMIAMVLTGL